MIIPSSAFENSLARLMYDDLISSVEYLTVLWQLCDWNRKNELILEMRYLFLGWWKWIFKLVGLLLDYRKIYNSQCKRHLFCFKSKIKLSTSWSIPISIPKKSVKCMWIIQSILNSKWICYDPIITHWKNGRYIVAHKSIFNKLPIA